MKLGLRRIQNLDSDKGFSSLISLPKTWVETVRAMKGDSVYFESKGEGLDTQLILTLERSPENAEKIKQELAVSSESHVQE